MGHAALVLVAGAASAMAPTLEDVDIARTLSVPGNFSHCEPIRELKCAKTADVGRFACTYREGDSKKTAGPIKNILLEQVGGNWTKLSGDRPTCSIVYIELPDQSKK